MSGVFARADASRFATLLAMSDAVIAVDAT
jgi:hypothetical protein